ncbi:hypothetical protein ACU686_27295 [Yinghuangia aomiensis]
MVAEPQGSADPGTDIAPSGLPDGREHAVHMRELVVVGDEDAAASPTHATRSTTAPTSSPSITQSRSTSQSATVRGGGRLGRERGVEHELHPQPPRGPRSPAALRTNTWREPATSGT